MASTAWNPTAAELEAMATIESRLDRCEDSRFWHSLAKGEIEIGDFLLVDNRVEVVK